MSVNSKMTAIADTIRSYTQDSEKLSLDGMAEKIALVHSKGYDSGFNQGYTDGRDAEYSSFWDVYQRSNDGTCRFAGKGWKRETFKPKYNISYANNYMLFRNSGIEGDLVEILNEIGVTLDTSNATTLIYAFSYTDFTRIGEINTEKCPSLQQVFEGSYKLETIDKLILRTSTTQTYNNCFRDCTALKNITFEGLIKHNIDFKSCPLTKKSIENIISVLSEQTTGYTLTLSLSAVNKAYETSEGMNNGSESEEWQTAVKEHSNWIISLV